MLLRLLFFIFLNLLRCITYAQIDTIWIDNEKEQDVIITSQLEWFRDSSRMLHWEDLNSNTSHYLKYPINTDTVELPTCELYWFRGCLCNKTESTIRRTVFSSYTTRTQVWKIYENGKVDSCITGDLVNEPELDIPYYKGNFRITIPPRQCISLIGTWEDFDRNFLRNTSPYKYILLRTEKSMKLNNFIKYKGQKHYPMNMAFMGILGFLSIFMFLQYLQFKDRAYLFYALYTASFFIFFLFRRSYWFTFPFRYVAEWSLFMEPYLAFLSIFLYIFFLRSFLFVRADTHPSLYKATQIAVYYIIGVWILFPVIYWLSSSLLIAGKFYVYSRNAFTIPAFYIIYLVFKEKNSLSTYFIWGTLALGFGGLIAFVNDLQKAYFLNIHEIPFDFQFSYLGNIQIGILLESIIFALALGYRNYLVQQQKEESERQLEITKDRLNRATLSPHFVFNALSAVKHLIQTGKTKLADSYLVQFSDLLRQVLNNLQKPNVTLAKELRLANQYLSLERLRFSEAFSYKIEVDKTINQASVFIPSMLLQPILENAVQHGLLSLKGRKGLVKLTIISTNTPNGIRICIEDNGIGRKAAVAHKKFSDHDSVGLSLTQQRVTQIDAGATLNIVDLLDPNGNANGTRVCIFIPTANYFQAIL